MGFQNGHFTSDSTTAEAGAGGINYISNPDFEASANSWNAYADAAGTSPVDGTGGSPNITITRTTSSPLRDTGSGLITKDAANRQGQGVSTDFTIAREDLAKMLQIEVPYEIASGTFATGDLTCYIVQDPSGTPTVIQPAGYSFQALGSSTVGKLVATFQTSSSVTTYRLCLHIASTSASAYTVKFDDVKVSPVVTTTSTFVGDWQSYTPSLTNGTNGTPTGKWRRVGDSMEVEFAIDFGGSGSGGTIELSLPSGHSSDTSKMVSSPVVGNAQWYKGGSGFENSQVRASGSSGVIFTKTAAAAFISGTDMLNTYDIRGTFTVPIVGWSSSQLTQDQSAEGRVVAMNVTGAPPTGTLTNSFNKVTFATTVADTHAGYSSGTYTIKVPGYYDISAVLGIAGTFSAAQLSIVRINKNNGTAIAEGRYRASASNIEVYPCVSIKSVFLNAGDTLHIDSYTEGSSPSFISSASQNYFTLHRIAGNEQVLASETVAVEAYKSGGNHTSNSSFQDVTSWTLESSTHGTAVFDTTTGLFTAPVSGRYQISFTVAFVGTASGYVQGLIGNQASAGLNSGCASPNNTVVGGVSTGGAVIRLSAGGQIKLMAFQSSGGTLAYATGTASTRMTIVRVGNY